MSTIKTTTLSTQGGSTVPVDTVVNGTAKAWVNFNGQGTVAIRRAFNVSSITDNGTGIYTVNFTTAMVDEGYAVNVTCPDYTESNGVVNAKVYGTATGKPSLQTTTQIKVAWITTNAFYDPHSYYVSVFS